MSVTFKYDEDSSALVWGKYSPGTEVTEQQAMIIAVAQIAAALQGALQPLQEIANAVEYDRGPDKVADALSTVAAAIGRQKT
jgi:hypothetical protein